MVSINIDNLNEFKISKNTLNKLNEGWLLLDYIGPKTIHFSVFGTNVDEISEYLNDKQIQYILARINNKCYSITYVGNKTSLNEKNNKLTLSNYSSINHYLQPFNYSYMEGEISNINKYNISKHY